MRAPDHRPGYHVAPETGWINDPNGPIEWDGRYHLFFQRNPLAATWSPRVHWGHAVSEDLCDWTPLPDALRPSADGPDAGGCWSGCVVDNAGTPTALYSGLAAAGADAAETVCLARGDPTLRTWRKDPRNPVIAGPPPGAGLTAFRDPFVWRENERWRMLIGAGMVDGGGAVLAYHSSDLLIWQPDGVLLRAADAGIATGSIWECPQYFELGDRRVLLLSVADGRPSHVVALVGAEAGGRFTVERADRFDHGADCYAPATMADSRGRRLAWAWSWEARSAPQAWAGALTLPRVLALAADGTLSISPAPELRRLRGTLESIEDVALGERLLARTRGDQVEIQATIEPGIAATVALRVRRSPAAEEETGIVLRRADGALVVDRSCASLDPAASGGAHGGQLRLAPREALRLHVFVDRSLVEVYANDRLTITERIYPTRADSTGIALDADGGEARLRDLRIWTLAGRRCPVTD
jgi:beta-fructofuranosidase